MTIVMLSFVVSHCSSHLALSQWLLV